jgi:hypothetical protein
MQYDYEKELCKKYLNALVSYIGERQWTYTNCKVIDLNLIEWVTMQKAVIPSKSMVKKWVL